MWRRAKCGDNDALIDQKFKIESSKLSQYRQLIERVKDLPGAVTLDTTRFVAPAAQQVAQAPAPAALADRAGRLDKAGKNFSAAQERRDARFDVLNASASRSRGTRPEQTPVNPGVHLTPPRKRRGLIEEAEELAEHVALFK